MAVLSKVNKSFGSHTHGGAVPDATLDQVLRNLPIWRFMRGVAHAQSAGSLPLLRFELAGAGKLAFPVFRPEFATGT